MSVDGVAVPGRPWPGHGPLHFPGGSFLQQTLSVLVERHSLRTVGGTRSELQPGSTKKKHTQLLSITLLALFRVNSDNLFLDVEVSNKHSLGEHCTV